MQTLEAMHRRIDSAGDLYGVVRVMKALASVSIGQYQRASESTVEYSRAIELGLQIVLREWPDEAARELPARGRRSGIVVFGSDQGMCGSFNERIASFVESDNSGEAPVAILAVGARVADRLISDGLSVERLFPVPTSVAGITPVIHEVLLAVEELRRERGVDRLALYHNRAAGEAGGPRKHELLPVDRAWLRELKARRWQSTSRPTFTMGRRPLFSALIRQHLFISLYRAFAESLAGENASRLASMQAAEKNIEAHLVELRAAYHRQRQESITEELLDIVSGFGALEGSRKGTSTRTPAEE